MFKFKKKKVLIGGVFDIDDENEWTLLIKPEIQDFPKFIHLRRFWNIKPLNEYVKARYEVHVGFIKDNKFVLEKTGHRLKTDSSKTTIQEMKKMYGKSLQEYLDKGYIKHEEFYGNDDIPASPIYHENQKTLDMASAITTSGASLQGIMQKIGLRTSTSSLSGDIEEK